MWDTGQQRAGWATVKVTGAPAGHADPDPLRREAGANGLVSITGFTPAGQIQTDYYIAKGTGTETFTPKFNYKGFQYVQIAGVGGTALPDSVTAVVDSVQEVREPMRRDGRVQLVERPAEPDRPQHARVGGRELRRPAHHRHADLREERLDR